MNTTKLYDKVRKQLTVVHMLTVLTVLLFEIVGYILLIYHGKEQLAWDSHFLWFGIVIPFTINALAHVGAKYLVHSKTVSPRVKTEAVIVAALVTAFVVSVFHRDYIVTSCAFVFPLILSSMFNDKKLLLFSFFSSLFILVCVVAACLLDGIWNLTIAIDLLILFGFAIVSFYCCILAINFSQRSEAIIVSQEKQNNELREDLLRDPMTDLYDHEAFLSHLETLVKSANDSTAFCLVMMDLDDFKSVNDTYGHDCGDQVLLFFAQAMQKRCDQSVTAYRYGGEEFALIFQNRSIGDACWVTHDSVCAFFPPFPLHGKTHHLFRRHFPVPAWHHRQRSV